MHYFCEILIISCDDEYKVALKVFNIQLRQ